MGGSWGEMGEGIGKFRLKGECGSAGERAGAGRREDEDPAGAEAVGVVQLGIGLGDAGPGGGGAEVGSGELPERIAAADGDA